MVNDCRGMISDVTVRHAEVIVGMRKRELIGRTTFFIDCESFLKMNYCSTMISDTSISNADVTVRVGEVWMIHREAFLPDLESLLVVK